MRNKLIAWSVLAALLCSCSPAGPVSNISTLLTLVTVAAEGAAALVTANSPALSVEQKAAINSYVKAVGAAVQVTAAEIQSTDSTAVKFAKSTLALAQAALPPTLLLPPDAAGIMTVLVVAVSTLSNAINQLYGPPASVRRAAVLKTPAAIALSSADRRVLRDLAKRGSVLAR